MLSTPARSAALMPSAPWRGPPLDAQAVRGPDDLDQLVVGHLLVGAGRGIGQHAAGGGDLDPVRAHLDRVAGHPTALVGSVADRLRGPQLEEFRLVAVDVAVAAGGGQGAAR